MQPLGIVETFGSPITCIGSELAVSPVIVKSAVLTDPQTVLDTNGKHSAIGLLLESVCCGNVSVSAEDKTLNPVEPVSTRIPSIV